MSLSSAPQNAVARSKLVSACQRLLGSTLRIGPTRARIMEVEGYLAGPGHMDPYAHAHPEQGRPDRWHLHRTGSGFRSGSYKGLDRTFAPPESRGGLLIRSLETAEGKVVCGPSLVVDHVLATLDLSHPQDLQLALDREGPEGQLLALSRPVPSTGPELSTARVGLTFKRLARLPSLPQFWALPYRYLVEPRRIRKGRVQIIVALHRQGVEAAELAKRLGSPLAAVDRTIRHYEAGRRHPGDVPLTGPDGPEELARILGALAPWQNEILAPRSR